MLEATFGLEVSETILTKHRYPDETEEVITSKDVSNSGVWKESVRTESKPCSKSTSA